MLRKTYACIGSRETPENIVKLTVKFANILAELGYAIYSGGCPLGMDMGGYRGAYSHPTSDKSKNRIYSSWEGMSGFRHCPDMGIYVPQNHFDNFQQAHDLGLKARGSWNGLGRGGIAHHSRNPYQVLGDDLASPVDFVLTWAPYARKGAPYVKGGTATAVQIAVDHNIPIYNLIDPELEDRIQYFCNVVIAQQKEKKLNNGQLLTQYVPAIG